MLNDVSLLAFISVVLVLFSWHPSANYKVRIYRRQPPDPVEASVGTKVEGHQEQPETLCKKADNEASDTLRHQQENNNGPNGIQDNLFALMIVS